ncbi:MAG: M20 metallopeptidase family protein [Phycisphaerales bacterium]
MTTTTEPMNLRAAIEDAVPDLVEIRRDLHAHPELSFQERRTSGRVCEELDRLGIGYKAGLAGGTGVVAHLPATDGSKGDCVALRADMDALPITEASGKPYASTSPGVMHACGHDGHTAILLGAARVLSRATHRPRPVSFIFQPAEESGGGGEKMCEDGALLGEAAGGLGAPVARIYGLHGWPSLELGRIVTRPGPMMASTDEFLITVRGVGGHAAWPQQCKDPVVAAAAVVMSLQTVVSRNAGPLEAAVCTVGRIAGGTVDNIIPETVELEGTTRALLPEVRSRLEERVRAIATGVAQAHGCTAEIRWNHGYPVTRNDPALADRALGTLRRVFGAERVGVVDQPVMGGEDFSYYGQHVPACFFFLGTRPAEADRPMQLHTSSFDFNDDAIAMGVETFCTLALAD